MALLLSSLVEISGQSAMAKLNFKYGEYLVMPQKAYEGDFIHMMTFFPSNAPKVGPKEFQKLGQKNFKSWAKRFGPKVEPRVGPKVWARFE